MDPQAELLKVSSRLKLEVPPKCFVHMGAKITEWKRGESMTCTFPVLAWYANPSGICQGGILSALFDNTFGPFSFLETERSTTTLDMDVSFTRPTPVNDQEHITITVTKEEQSKTYLLLKGVARRSDGKTVALATTRMQIFAIEGAKP
jgi:uncharacterized protein (TIGR00369 family)